MKKIVFPGIIALMLIMIANPSAWAATEVNTPDIPSDFLDIAKWPRVNTESCRIAGKEYRETVYARITDDKNIEYVVTVSLNGTIFQYEYAKGGKEPNVIIDFIRSENGWIRFNQLIEDSTNRFYNYLIENGVPPSSPATFCANVSLGFEKFWHELFNEIGVK